MNAGHGERPGAKNAGKDDWTDHWQKYAATARDNPAQAMRHSLVLDELARLGPLDMLVDIGSGQGDFLARACGTGAARSCVGFEMSESGVAISRQKVPEAAFHQVDILRPADLARSFSGKADAAVCSDVIEHVDDPAQFLREAASYLKDGGAIVVTVPGGPMSAFDRHIGHRRHFSASAIREVLGAAGLSVERVTCAGFPFFNLYRLVVILRGKRLIEEAATGQSPEIRMSGLARLFMRLFHFLFRFNLHRLPWGWQVVAVARRRPGVRLSATG